MPRQLLSPIPAIMGWRGGKRERQRKREAEGYLRGRQIARNPRAARKIDASDTISLLYTVRWINHSPRLPSSRRSARRGSTSSYFPCFHSQISSTSIHVPVIPPRNGSASEELIPPPCLPLLCAPSPSPLPVTSRAILSYILTFPRRLPLVNRNEHEGPEEELPVIKC